MRTSSRDFVIVLFDEVELLDVAAVMQVASAAGRHWNWRPFRLIPAALTPGLVTTRSQVRLEATSALADHPKPELLLVPGGYGARRAAAQPELLRWLEAAAGGAEHVLAIGAGVAALGAAGLLSGAVVAATTQNAAWLASELPNTLLNTEQAIVSSGKLMTAATSVDGLELGFSLVERCLGRSPARSVRSALGSPQAERIELHDAWPEPLKPAR